MKTIVLCISAIFLGQPVFSQDTISPYKVNYLIDVPVTIGVAAAGLLTFEYIVKNKAVPDSAHVSTLSPSDVNRFDRGATKYYNGSANTYSDISQAGSYLLPALLLLSPDIAKNKAEVGVLYLQTMAFSGFIYVASVSLISRNRPYVYNPDVPVEKKTRYLATNSFFAGHPSTVASASFFTAKVFHDYYPSSKYRFLAWTAAGIPPVVVSYFRYKAGQHFLTDIIAGIPIGAAIGILVPHLHKKKQNNDRFSFSASPAGMYCAWKF